MHAIFALNPIKLHLALACAGTRFSLFLIISGFSLSLFEWCEAWLLAEWEIMFEERWCHCSLLFVSFNKTLAFFPNLLTHPKFFPPLQFESIFRSLFIYFRFFLLTFFHIRSLINHEMKFISLIPLFFCFYLSDFY